MLQSTFEVEKPNDVVFTLKITAPLSEFRQLQKQLASEWPSWQLTGAINDLISAATNTFREEPKEPYA